MRDCFLLARDARELDMRASPYDGEFLPEAVRIETNEGISNSSKTLVLEQN